MEFRIIRGIYAIKCTVNQKVYVGKSENCILRIGQHLNDLKFLRHHCKELQSDFDLFNASSFTYEILREASASEDKNKLKELEILYISNIRPELLYNANLIENRLVSFDMKTGEITGRFFNYAQAALETGISAIQIYWTCNKVNFKSAKGVGFCFESDIDNIPKLMRRKQHSNSYKIKAFDKNDNFIREFESQSEAARFLKVHRVLINSCLKGRIKSTHGFKFIKS